MGVGDGNSEDNNGKFIRSEGGQGFLSIDVLKSSIICNKTNDEADEWI